MTVWTDPRTWGASDVPTAAQFNTHIRDNLLHLYESVDGFGFPYCPGDPRLVAAGGGTSWFAGPKYYRAYGRGTITGIAINVLTSTGNIVLGCYRNTVTDAVAKGIPGPRVATTGLVACPALGRAVVTLVDGPATMEPGDWFASSGDGPAAGASQGQGATGWVLNQLFDPIVIFNDVDGALDILPNPADPDFESSGSAAGLIMVGVA